MLFRSGCWLGENVGASPRHSILASCLPGKAGGWASLRTTPLGPRATWGGEAWSILAQLASELSTHPLMAACHCVSPPPARPGMDQALSVPGAPLSFPVQSKSKPAPSVPFKTRLDAGLSPGTPISITIAIPVSQASSPPWMKPSFQPPLSPLSSSPSASPPCVATPVFPTETVLPLSLLEPPVTSHDSG